MRDWNLKRTFVIVHNVTHLISHQEELGNLTLGKIILIPPAQYFHRRLAANTLIGQFPFLPTANVSTISRTATATSTIFHTSLPNAIFTSG